MEREDYARVARVIAMAPPKSKEPEPSFKEELVNAGGDFLEHHGILGMKWGVQNGPPYPLDTKTHNGVIAKIKKKSEERDKKNFKTVKKAYKAAKLRQGKNIINYMEGDVSKAEYDSTYRKNHKIIRKYAKRFDGKVPSDNELVKQYRSYNTRLINKYNRKNTISKIKKKAVQYYKSLPDNNDHIEYRYSYYDGHGMHSYYS